TQHCVGDYAYNNNLGLCYKLYDTELEYLEARLFCERDRAKLVIINTPAELQYFAGILGGINIHLLFFEVKSNLIRNSCQID
ncbi:hypothetical protein ACJMK2_000762, partial [Sinanodonta woodiana]